MLLSSIILNIFPIIASISIVLLLKSRVGDLFPIKIGDPQTYWKEKTPGSECVKQWKIVEGKTKSINILSYNFPLEEYSNSEFRDALERWYEKGVEIRIIVGPCIEAEEAFAELEEKNQIKFGIVDKPPTEHIVTIDYPEQIWVERIHKGDVAKNVYYTEKPYADVFQDADNIFEALWAQRQNQ